MWEKSKSWPIVEKSQDRLSNWVGVPEDHKQPINNLLFLWILSQLFITMAIKLISWKWWTCTVGKVKSKCHILIQISGIRNTKAIDKEPMDSFTSHIVIFGILICYGRYYAYYREGNSEVSPFSRYWSAVVHSFQNSSLFPIWFWGDQLQLTPLPLSKVITIFLKTILSLTMRQYGSIMWNILLNILMNNFQYREFFLDCFIYIPVRLKFAKLTDISTNPETI